MASGARSACPHVRLDPQTARDYSTSSDGFSHRMFAHSTLRLPTPPPILTLVSPPHHYTSQPKCHGVRGKEGSTDVDLCGGISRRQTPTSFSLPLPFLRLQNPRPTRLPSVPRHVPLHKQAQDILAYFYVCIPRHRPSPARLLTPPLSPLEKSPSDLPFTPHLPPSHSTSANHLHSVILSKPAMEKLPLARRTQIGRARMGFGWDSAGCAVRCWLSLTTRGFYSNRPHASSLPSHSLSLPLPLPPLLSLIANEPGS